MIKYSREWQLLMKESHMIKRPNAKYLMKDCNNLQVNLRKQE